MRKVLPFITLLLTITSLTGQSRVSVLLLPPLGKPAHDEAQKKLVGIFQKIAPQVFKDCSIVVFHNDSPSILRARKEGKLPEEALKQPHDYAPEICQVEGAKAAFYFEVTRTENKTSQVVKAVLVFPTDFKFVTDLKEQPATEEELKTLKSAVKEKDLNNDLNGEIILAWRICQWLQSQLKIEEIPSSAISLDMQTLETFIAEGKLEEAIRIVSELLNQNPTDPKLYLQLGRLYEQRQRWYDASLEYRRAVQLQSDLWEAWKGIARTAEKREQWDLVLEATRRLKQCPDNTPDYLLLGTKAAGLLAEEAFRRGRDRQSEELRKEAVSFVEDLVKSADDYQILSEVAKQLIHNRQFELALEAIEKTIKKRPEDINLREQAITSALEVKRSNVAYQHLIAIVQTVKGYRPELQMFRQCLKVMDIEAVKLFERVRDDISNFDVQKLTKEELLVRLKQLNSEAEQLLRIAHSITPHETYKLTYDRRLLSYDLYLQATSLLIRWLDNQDDLARRRAVVFYEFSRLELETSWTEEAKLR